MPLSNIESLEFIILLKIKISKKFFVVNRSLDKFIKIINNFFIMKTILSPGNIYSTTKGNHCLKANGPGGGVV